MDYEYVMPYAIPCFVGLMVLCTVVALLVSPLNNSKTTNEKFIGFRIVNVHKGCCFECSCFDIYSIYKNNIEELEVQIYPNDLKWKLKEIASSKGYHIDERDLSGRGDNFVIYLR